MGLDEASNREAIAAAEAHEGVFACVGRHPNSAGGFDDAAAADIEGLARPRAVAAIGETGLDYYRDRAPREEQRRAFEAQIGIARERAAAGDPHAAAPARATTRSPRPSRSWPRRPRG